MTLLSKIYEYGSWNSSSNSGTVHSTNHPVGSSVVIADSGTLKIKTKSGQPIVIKYHPGDTLADILDRAFSMAESSRK